MGEYSRPWVEILLDCVGFCQWHGELTRAFAIEQENVWDINVLEKLLQLKAFFFFLTANRFLKFSSNFSDAPLCWSRAKNPELKIQIPVRTYNIMKWQVGGVDLSPYYDLITLWKEVSRATYCKYFPGRWHISEVRMMKVWRWCKCITHGLSLTRTILQDLTQDPPLQIFCLVQRGVSRAYTIPSNMTTKWCDIKKLSQNGPVKGFGVKKILSKGSKDTTLG